MQTNPLHTPGTEADGSGILLGIALLVLGMERKEFDLGMKEVSTIFPGVNTTFIMLRNQAQHIQGNWG